MKSTKLLESSVISLISTALASHGFTKRGLNHVKPITEECFGWCGLNIAKQHLDGGIGINPVVGITFNPIEVFIQQTLKNKRKEATLSSSVGYLTPEQRFLEWIFPPDNSIDVVQEVEKIIDSILLYGEPFMKRHANLGAIIQNLENVRYTDRDSASFRLPIAYRLNGQTEKAREFIQRVLFETKDLHYEAIERKRHLFTVLLNESDRVT